MKGTELIDGRRRALRVAAALALWPAAAWPQGADVGIRWDMPRDKVRDAREAIGEGVREVQADAGSAPNTKGLPVLYVFLAVLSLPQLAKACVDVYKDWKYGAPVVSVNAKGEVAISHDEKFSNDVVIVTTADGKVQVIDGRSRFDAAKWLEVLSKTQPSAAGKPTSATK